MARPGYDSPAGRRFHGLAGDTPIFESKHVRVDQEIDDDRVFVVAGPRGGDSIRAYLPQADAIAMAKAVLERLERPVRESAAEVTAALARTGHGHVVPRTDGMVARCGGPGLCRECAADQRRLDEAKEQR